MEKTVKSGIYKKLLDFQKTEITVTKDGTNPHFKSRYVTLNEVLAKVKKPLNDAGILIIQTPSAEGLTTRLIDTDDESEVSCFMPYVESTTAQKLGSNNTYNRRYSLVTLLGLEDEDDDGNVASEKTIQTADPKPAKPKVTLTAYQSAEKAIIGATTPEKLSEVEAKITISEVLKDEEKHKLLDMIEARSQLMN